MHIVKVWGDNFRALHLYEKYELFMMIYMRSSPQFPSYNFFYPRKYFMFPKVIKVIQDNEINTLQFFTKCVVRLIHKLGREQTYYHIDKTNKNREFLILQYMKRYYSYNLRDEVVLL